MKIQNTFNNMATVPDICSVLKAASNKNALDLNCMRIGIVQEFYPEDLTVSVLIANKKELKQNQDGTQNVRNFALIRAKVCFCNPFITNPIKQGDECVLLFSDREIESWFINGDVNPIAYPRMHDLTDAVAIFGIRSLPNMISILQDCLNLFFYGSDIEIKPGETIINSSNITLNANSTITLNAPNVNTTGNLNVATGYSGIVPCGGATLSITNGIITGVS